MECPIELLVLQLFRTSGEGNSCSLCSSTENLMLGFLERPMQSLRAAGP